MIGRMRPFYQAHWDISKDIKHVWLLICTYYIAWILGDEGRGENGDCSRSVVRTVSTGCETPQCAASWMLLLYARDSSRWLLTPSPQFLSRGAQTFWHRARAYSIIASVNELFVAICEPIEQFHWKESVCSWIIHRFCVSEHVMYYKE